MWEMARMSARSLGQIKIVVDVQARSTKPGVSINKKHVHNYTHLIY